MTVQQRLLANARPEMRQRINHVLATVPIAWSRRGAGRQHEPRDAQDPVRLRARIVECAESRNLPELLDALAVLSEVPGEGHQKIFWRAEDWTRECWRLGERTGSVRTARTCKNHGRAGPRLKKNSESTPTWLFASYTALSA